MKLNRISLAEWLRISVNDIVLGLTSRGGFKKCIRAMFLDLLVGHGKPGPTLTLRWEVGALPTR